MAALFEYLSAVYLRKMGLQVQLKKGLPQHLDSADCV